jgi:hypothetical protein
MFPPRTASRSTVSSSSGAAATGSDGAKGVVVAGDDVVDLSGIAVGVDDGDDRDAKLAGFGNGDGFVVGVNDEDGVGKALHALDTREVGREVLALALELDDFLLGEEFVTTVGGHIVKFLEALYGLLHGDPVSEETAEPAAVDVRHAGAGGFLGDGILRLALGADEEDELTGGGEVGDELGGFLEELEGLLEVDDVNAVALSEDVFLHLGIPALGLMPEVNSSFEQFFHSNVCQCSSLVEAAECEHRCLD